MNRLATRIFVAFFLTLIVTALGVVGITRWFMGERATALEQFTVAAAESAALALAEGGRDGLIAWLRTQDPTSGVFIVDEWGDELLGRTIPAAPPVPLPRVESTDEAVTELERPGVVLRLPQRMPILVTADDERFRLIVTPFRRGMTRPDAWTLPLLLIGLLALASTGLVSFALARSLTRPIETLERASRSVSDRALRPTLPATLLQRGDELGHLARAFDAMTLRLSELVSARDRLLREVSHELRSPLARMRVALGLMRTDSLSSTHLDRLDTEIARLDELVGSLLDLARLDGDAPQLRQERFDVIALAERVVADAAFEACGRGCRIQWQAPPQRCELEGDPNWVSAALENVLRNAIHHTTVDSEVVVEAQIESDRAAPEVLITIRDRGPGVPESELERIFEPFHRLPSHRPDLAAQLAGEPVPRGMGLGLAIAARVVRAHGGRVIARNRLIAGVVSGLEVEMRWRIARPAEESNR